MKPLIRWAGSKKSLLPILRPYWPKKAARYVEPFCGSACLFFDLEPKAALLSDINSELITTYRAIRLDPTKVTECLLRYRKSKATYYAVRKASSKELNDFELAARFLFLNRLSFNGIYRTNMAGQFNVPYAQPKHPVVFDPSQLLAASQLLRSVELQNSDFENILKTTKKSDFVYLDPPYAVARRRVFSEYYPGSFSEDDLERLADCLHLMHKRGITFVISYADSSEGRALLKPWNVRRVRTRRNVAGFAGHRKHAFELLASNVEPG